MQRGKNDRIFTKKNYQRCVVGQGSLHYIYAVMRNRSPDWDSGFALAEVCAVRMLLFVYANDIIIYARKRKQRLDADHLQNHRQLANSSRKVVVQRSTVAQVQNFQDQIFPSSLDVQPSTLPARPLCEFTLKFGNLIRFFLCLH